MTPEQFLIDYPPQIQELAQELRTLVKDVVPDIDEKVYRGWQLIGYRAKRTGSQRRDRGAYFCYIAPRADTLQLGFEYGVLLADQEGLLEGQGKQVRYITFTPAADFERAGVKRLIVEAARVALLSKEEKADLRFEVDGLREIDRDQS